MLMKMRTNRDSPSLLVRTQNGTVTWDDSWFLTKLNILLPHNSSVTLVGIYPKDLRTYVLTKICIWMFTASLLLTAKTWEQTRYPAVGEWINCDVLDNEILFNAKG